MNFNYLLWKWREESEIIKRGGCMVKGQVLKGGWYAYLVFSRFIIFTFRNYFTLCKIVLCIWREMIFCHIYFMKKGSHSMFLKVKLCFCKKVWYARLGQAGCKLVEEVGALKREGELEPPYKLLWIISHKMCIFK